MSNCRLIVRKQTFSEGCHTLYRATFPNGKLYFGITKNALNERINSHYNQANNAKKNGTRLNLMQRALLKNERASVIWEVVASNLHIDFAKALEIAHISMFDTLRKCGYNLTPGGDIAPVVRESRASISKRFNTETFGAYKVDTLEKAGQWNSIIQASEDLSVDQSNIGRCLVGKTVSHKGYIFCKLKDASNLPLLQSHAQINRKKKFEVTDSNGNLVGTWDNTNQCARDLDLPTPREIRAVLNSPRRSSYKSYKFKFV